MGQKEDIRKDIVEYTTNDVQAYEGETCRPVDVARDMCA